RFSRDWSSDVCSSDLGGQHWFYKNDYYYYIVVDDESFGEMNIYMHVHNSGSGMHITILNGGDKSYSLEGDSYLFNGIIYNISQRSEERRVGKECRSQC